MTVQLGVLIMYTFLIMCIILLLSSWKRIIQKNKHTSPCFLLEKKDHTETHTHTHTCTHTHTHTNNNFIVFLCLNSDIIVIAGGVIPPQDYEELYASGCAAIFGPGLYEELPSTSIKILISHTFILPVLLFFSPMILFLLSIFESKPDFLFFFFFTGH